MVTVKTEITSQIIETDAPETEAPEADTDATDAEGEADTETDDAPLTDGTDGDNGAQVYVIVGVSLAGALLIGAVALWLARRKK